MNERRFNLMWRSEACRAGATRAFTLIEAIVVIVILGVVAGFAAPRLMVTQTRRIESDVRAVSGLLSLAAQREALGRERVSLKYEKKPKSGSDGARLELMVLRWRDDGSRFGTTEWRPDPLVEPVVLQFVELEDGLLDGVALDEDQWTVELPQHEPRPRLDLLLNSMDPPALQWHVAMAPHESSATWARVSSARSKEQTIGPIDLDQLGLGDRPW